LGAVIAAQQGLRSTRLQLLLRAPRPHQAPKATKPWTFLKGQLDIVDTLSDPAVVRRAHRAQVAHVAARALKDERGRMLTAQQRSPAHITRH
jgi:hypothetical protein